MAGFWKFDRYDDEMTQYERIKKKDEKTQKIWIVFALINAIGVVILVIGLIYIKTLPQTVPVIISVTDWGEAKYQGEVSHLNYQNIKIPDIAIEYQIRKFVNNFYEIPGDPDILKKNIIDCYSALTGDSAEKMSAIIKETNPLKNYGQQRRKVDIETILQTSKNSYQVDFVVTNTDAKDARKTTTRMRGILTIGLLEPAKEDQILNPLGIYIRSFDFKEIN